MKQQLCGLMLNALLANSVMLAQAPNSASESGTRHDSSGLSVGAELGFGTQ
jgi:hypothetical protein